MFLIHSLNIYNKSSSLSIISFRVSWREGDGRGEGKMYEGLGNTINSFNEEPSTS